MGTPAYVAPEQFEGGRVTGAADIYALGVVLYEMTTGKQPFTGESAFAVAARRLQEKPAPPRTNVPDLDPGWEAAVLRCLERKTEDRFATPAEVVEALAAEPVETKSAARWSGAAPKGGVGTATRRRVAAAAGAGLVLGLAGLGFYLFTGSGEAIDSLAVLPFVNAGADVVLDPRVAKLFPNSASVNSALLSLAAVAKRSSRRGRSGTRRPAVPA